MIGASFSNCGQSILRPLITLTCTRAFSGTSIADPAATHLVDRQTETICPAPQHWDKMPVAFHNTTLEVVDY